MSRSTPSPTPRAAGLIVASILAAACGDTPPADAAATAPAAGPVVGTGGLAIVNPLDPERDYNFDLGHLEYGDVRELVVRLRNDDGRPLEVQRVVPGCGCTVPSLRWERPDGTVATGATHPGDDPLTLPPGAVAELTLRVDTRRSDKQNTSKRVLVRITSDSPTNPFLTLEVHFIVDVPFQATPGRLDLHQVPAGGGGVAATELIAATDDAVRLDRVDATSPGVEAELIEEQRFGMTVWTVRARLLPPLELGTYLGFVRLGLADAEGQPLERTFELDVQAHVVPDLGLDPSRLVFPPVPAERMHETVAEADLVARLPGQRVGLLEATLEGPQAEHLRLETLPVQVDAEGRASRWRLRLHAEPSLTERVFSGTLRLTLDDPQFPELEVPYMGRFRE